MLYKSYQKSDIISHLTGLDVVLISDAPVDFVVVILRTVGITDGKTLLVGNRIEAIFYHRHIL